MRRRTTVARRLEAQELVDLYLGLRGAFVGESIEVRNHHLRQGLAEYGYTPLDAIRARYWLRRGRPADYQWDQHATPRSD